MNSNLFSCNMSRVKGHSVIDHGPESGSLSVDYPDFADKVCKSVTTMMPIMVFCFAELELECP